MSRDQTGLLDTFPGLSCQAVPTTIICITGGRSVWNIRYADDTTLLTRKKDDLYELADASQQGGSTAKTNC